MVPWYGHSFAGCVRWVIHQWHHHKQYTWGLLKMIYCHASSYIIRNLCLMSIFNKLFNANVVKEEFQYQFHSPMFIFNQHIHDKGLNLSLLTFLLSCGFNFLYFILHLIGDITFHLFY